MPDVSPKHIDDLVPEHPDNVVYSPKFRTPPQEDPVAIIRGDHFLEQQYPAAKWLVDGVWPANGFGFVAGPPKSFKSWITEDIALAIVTGSTVLGFQCTQGRVLIVDAENIGVKLQERIKGLAAGRGIPNGSLSQLDVAPMSRLKIDDDDDFKLLEGQLFDTQYALVVLDPLNCFHHSDENSSSEMSFITERIKYLSHRYDTAVMVVHHSRKPQAGTPREMRAGASMRGSSVLWSSMDCAIFVEARGANIHLDFESKYGPPPEHKIVELRAEQDAAYLCEVR